MKNGLVVNLGCAEGCVDFPSIVSWQRTVGYEGFVCVEQETTSQRNPHPHPNAHWQETYDPRPAGLDMLKNKLYLDELYQG